MKSIARYKRGSFLCQGLRLVRKEITHVDSSFAPESEPEILFLLGSLKHRNVVELLAAYVQNNVYNLMFLPTDMDLESFLLQPIRPVGFEEDRSMFNAMQGLASGLRHLHFFELSGTRITESSTLLYGTHQDIKPKNVLVRGADFVLADFGLSRLKPIEKGSQTIWKDATYEYGAPECRDRTTFVQGHISRASDIWSLSCCISELMVYMNSGSEGVQEFRNHRLMKDYYGVTRAFHDGARLKDQILESLAEVEREADSSAISTLSVLLKEMFAECPIDRPNAKDVEACLERTTMIELIRNLLDAIAESYIGTNVFQISLRLEENRVRAWAGVLGLVTLPGQSTTNTLQYVRPFTESYETIETAILKMNSPRPFSEALHNEEFAISVLRQLNDTINNHLPEPTRGSADRLFAILSTATSDLKCLSAIRNVTLQESSEYKDIGAIAAMRYMSILLSQKSEQMHLGSKVEHPLIEEDAQSIDFKAHPKMYWWYNEEYLPDHRQRVLVEWRDYDKKLPSDVRSEEFRVQVQTMYRRVQGLVKVLSTQPKPPSFRVLDCVGTFHDFEDRRFGIVYTFPSTQLIPFRLHYLLKGGGAKGLRPPHIGQRLTLAKTLAACLQIVHVSGWVHKDINSYNILFFTSANPLSDGDYEKPYLVGFEHSREDEQGAYTRGTESFDETKHYQHPRYWGGSSAFRKEFDYYSLGLVLLEIGVWECLGNIYNNVKRLESTPWELKDEYMRICNNQILERMGPTYHEVTRTCLEAAEAHSKFSREEVDIMVDFQRDVVDKLESCRF